MPAAPQSDLSVAGIAYHSADEILAHPRFPAARTAFVDAVLDLYEGDIFLNRLLLEAGRTVMFIIIICLHARYDEDDRTTWPTMSLLQKAMAQYGLASPRRIEDLVARLIHTDILASVESTRDRRFRILTPTPKMLALDQGWLRANYLPLHVMFPDPGYGPLVDHNPDVQRAQRLVANEFFGLGAKVLAGNPDIMLFMMRDAGIMVLFKLIQMAAAQPDQPEGLSYADIGARFGVSRTHVRQLLQDAEKAGLVALSGRGGRLVELKPPVLAAFDRFLAEGMSGHDLMYRIAASRMAKES